MNYKSFILNELFEKVHHELHDLLGFLTVNPVAGTLHVAELRDGESLLDLIVVRHGDVVALGATNEQGRSDQLERGFIL